MWFKPLRLVDFSSSCICFSVPKQFYADWINENYRDIIKEVIRDMTGFSPELSFKIYEEDEPAASKKQPEIKKPPKFAL